MQAVADFWMIFAGLWTIVAFRQEEICFLCIEDFLQSKPMTTYIMKITKFILGLASGALVLASCAENGLSVFEASESPYADAAVRDAVTAQINVRLDQKYRTVKLPLSGLGITVSDGDVFYAPSELSADWCGEDWYSSEFGFYISSEGKACYRSSEDARLFAEYYPAGVNGASEPVIAVGQIPDACVAGDEITFEVGFANTEAKQPVKITVNVLEALPWATYMEHEDGLTYTVYQEVNTDYTALEIPVNEKAIMKALGIDSLKPLLEAMQSDTAYDTTMRGVNSDGEYDGYDKYTANVAGYWFNQNGDVCEWKNEGWGAYIEWDRTSPMIFRLGQAVENNVVGSRYDMKIALILDGKEAVLTFRLKIVSEVTDDLGLL